MYSLKVWLSVVLITPALYIIFSLIMGIRDTDLPVPAAYVVLAVAEAIFSFLTALFFYAATSLVVTSVANNIMRKIMLSIIGLVLTAITFLVFSPLIGAPLTTSTLALSVPNAICVVAACWYFRLPATANPLKQ
jgi:hypothetical protein